jgi:hypothetical protein
MRFSKAYKNHLSPNPVGDSSIDSIVAPSGIWRSERNISPAPANRWSKIATMFREHESLDTPEDDTILWRYLDLSHFLNLLNRQTFYFANRREFDDSWEGAIPATTTEAAKRVDRYLSGLFTELRGFDVSRLKGSERVESIENSIR